tara:strand:- start:427 stop:627 length:201 start_codon:yes stop_codon:yes gene_type:complete
MDKGKAECELLRKAIWFPYERQRITTELIHCKLYLKSANPKEEDLAMDTRIQFLKGAQLWFQPNAK